MADLLGAQLKRVCADSHYQPSDPDAALLSRELCALVNKGKLPGVLEALAREQKFADSTEFSRTDALSARYQFMDFCGRMVKRNGFVFSAKETNECGEAFPKSYITPAGVNRGVVLAVEVNLKSGNKLSAESRLMDCAELNRMGYRFSFKTEKQPAVPSLYSKACRLFGKSDRDLILHDESLKQEILPKLVPLVLYPFTQMQGVTGNDLAARFSKLGFDCLATNIRAQITRMQITPLLVQPPARPRRRG